MVKEKTDRQLTVMVQPSLFNAFEKVCNESHRSVSEVVRELMSKHSQGWHQLPPYITIPNGSSTCSEKSGF